MKKFILTILTLSYLANNLFALQQDKVLAVVNSEEITVSKIAGLLQEPRFRWERLDEDRQKKLLDGVIDEILISQYALKTDVVKSDEYKKALKSLEEMLANQAWKKEQAENIKISTKELKAEYKKNKKYFKVPAKFHARHILLENEKDAKAIIKKLKLAKNVKKAFIKLAKEKSTGPSGINGGDLGWSSPDKMVKEFSDAALKLKAGEFSKKPVKTQFGYHVIYMEGHKKASTIPFAEVKDKLEQSLKAKKLMDLFKNKAKKLKAKANIIYK